VLDEELERLGEEFHIPAELARRILGTMARDQRDPRRWTEHAALQKQLRGRFHDIQAVVAELASGTIRASSLVENLNSRLRSYFFLRRHLGPDKARSPSVCYPKNVGFKPGRGTERRTVVPGFWHAGCGEE
jgi:hypothetical protein